MRAAAQTGSQSLAGPRTKVPPKAAAPRAAKKRTPPRPSKLRTAHGAGISRPLAILASVLLLALILAVVLATGGRGEWLARTGRQAVDTHLGSVGFRLDEVHLQGASRAAQGEVLKAAAIPLGAPILTLDLGGIRRRVESVGWVERARVVRLLPDTLVIAIDERPLMAVWEHAGRAVVVTANGAIAGKVDPVHFTTLPLIVGDGANLAAAAILPSVFKRPRLAQHLDSLVRVDGRRWNIRLKDGGLIMLPATGEDAALNRFDTLDGQARILDLGFERIDLRDPDMVVVRPRGAVAPVAAAGGK